MAWIRLYLTVEGQTERRFAEAVLQPHLAQFEVDLRPRVVVTQRKLDSRGGIFSFAKLRNDLIRLMRQDRQPEARFTTMVDLYALPSDFPGWVEAKKQNTAQKRVATLEAALEAEMGDPRFLPYIQLHEFEALLYCDLSQLARRITKSEKAFADLQREVDGLTPEEINEGTSTAPSKRIIKYVPLYKHLKVRVGAPAAEAIGLNTLRAKCPHFHEWVSQLERLSER
ncbi:MAG: DUF4276 family protein [Anaerolineae bacterium]|nr:DUF4276 family protein [Anaerolineae bacterium]